MVNVARKTYTTNIFVLPHVSVTIPYGFQVTQEIHPSSVNCHNKLLIDCQRGGFGFLVFVLGKTAVMKSQCGNKFQGFT